MSRSNPDSLVPILPPPNNVSGALDPDDESIADGFDGEPDRVLKFAAVREVFEESGVWLFEGGGRPSSREEAKAWRGKVHESAGAAAAMMEHFGCRPAFSKLHRWCSFQTPDVEAVKLKKGGFDTAFYVAACTDDDLDHLDADQAETTMMCWLSISARGAQPGPDAAVNPKLAHRPAGQNQAQFKPRMH